MNLSDIRPAHVQAARRELARRSLPDFACLIDIPTVPLTDAADEDRFSVMRLDSLVAHHRLLLEKLQGIEDGSIANLMILLPPGSAKALALDTPIPTPGGWRSMGDLQAGDQVFGEDGKPCRVTWVSPIWRARPVYNVTTDCGDVIRADADHEWRVRLCRKPRLPMKGNGKGAVPLANRDDPASHFKIKKTSELHRRRAKRPMIERAGALDLPDADLPIDPYVLGVWLGDGHSAGMRITSSVEDQPWVRAELARLGYATRDSSVSTLFGLPKVRAKFVALGLLNDPEHSTHGRKHIPAAYLRASADQRLSLLQGLIDTDGTVCAKRGCATFCNTNRELAESVRELARSLGVKAGWSEGIAMLDGKDCGPVYRVGFYHARAARMPRKAVRCRDQYRTPNTYLDVTPAGVADTMCIEVDSPSHLYLCGRSMTPTHNSTYADVVFVPWFMARASRRHVILASYASEIAEKQGRRARQLINSRSFRNLTGQALRPDAKAAHQWTLENGSEFMSGGILAGLTGNRAALGICDDLLRGREAAESETIRDKTWEAYRDDFCSRLIPGAPQVMIGTRWHEADPAGRILPEDWAGESGALQGRDGRQWQVLCLPAIADRADDPLGRSVGQTLWPEWFSLEHWAPFRLNARSWASLYQQQPSPETGTFFRREWFRRYRPGSEPKAINHYMTSDHAPGGEADSDYTCVRVWGVDPAGDLYMLDGFRTQETLDLSIDKAMRLVKRYRPLAWLPEDDNSWKAVAGFVRRQMLDLNTFCRIEPVSPHGADKKVKAQAFQGMAANGKVWIAEGPEGDDVIEQYVRFPGGRNDDEVDCVAEHTLIAMADGRALPVEQVRQGDRVLTPGGFGVVMAVQMTIASARVMRLRLANGQVLIATPNHPIATENGFVCMDSISLNDRVLIQGLPCRSPSFSTGRSTVAIRRASTCTIEPISRLAVALASCIATSGSLCMGLFRPGWSFITSTATPPTTGLTIWRVSRQQITGRSTLSPENRLPGNVSTLTGFDPMLPSGTSRLRDWLGTTSIPSRLQNSARCGSWFAGAATRALRRFIAAMRFVARTSASNGSGFAGLTQPTSRQPGRMSIAPSAARSFSEGTPSPSCIAGRPASGVLAIEKIATRHDVFNMTVAGENVFYANGVLTHNCAAIIGRAIADAHPGIVPPEKKKPAGDRWDRAFDRDDGSEENWKTT